MTDFANTPLIPRDDLFGNPSRAGGKISPDGKWVSWMAPWQGVMNVFMAPADDQTDVRRMTAAEGRPIPQYFWAPDSQSLLYIRDRDGDENYLLYQVGLDGAENGGVEKCLTPFENTRVQIVGVSETQRDRLLVGLNDRDPRFHDVHLLNLETGELSLVFENNAWAGFEADDSLTLRWAVRQNAAGGTDMHEIIDGVVAETPREVTGMEDSLITSMAGYTTDGTILYWIDSRGRDTAALYAEDMATGARTLLAEHDRADVGGTIRHPRTGVVQGWSAAYLRTEHHFLDDDIASAFAFLRERFEGDFGIQSRTDDDRRWLVWNDPLTGPIATYLFDRDAMSLTRFYVTKPELEGAPLQPMHPVEIPARDGLTLASYLTLPPGCDPDEDGVPDAAVPMVLLVHGGPWARDNYGFNRSHQWLANRGYAVLSVNFRGSMGFGKAFVNAANLQWSKAMHDDLIDAVDWAVERGVAQRDRIAIMGGSYGGYATLVGLAFTPEVFACGVDIVGPSNLETLLETIPPYWEPLVKQFHDRMGDPGTPEGLQALKEASPLHRAKDIVRPLLIGQGANDPRVKQAESDQIVDAMERDGVPVTYVLFPDEGHGFARPENNIAFNAIAENFLAEVLGGRAEPVGETLAASTADIRAGREFVKGL
ncbi:prolyl oligopeptidase family serine peptidase [Erythrobacter arachoides]|uniref:Prolyl oligopeptidase family serine peptidase n=1 Tax=Aurantiacibacter arachoides TaxID=1850444 RepID=A0A845A4F4_9SPHN|nr:S9 family peptidase [Aurantiacibacter arachoides]MXO92469.1 prolyl oligopeptidase family serine peptidase [Aurantiacibacter arachoides]GGD56929.1 peptidase S9 [Aurantiacibacter arachoides]